MSEVSEPDMVFADADIARKYVEFRPQPPPSLIRQIVLLWNEGLDISTAEAEKPQPKPTPGTLLVDVGCGSGQSTHQFASYFDRVIGIDVSQDQLNVARQKFKDSTNMTFEEGRAEHLPFNDKSVDVVTVCAAVHWFNLRAFYAEVDRVLKPGGVLAVYSYLNAHPLYKGRCLRQSMAELWESLEFWSPEHLHLKTNYASLPSAYDEEVHLTGAEGNFEVSKDGHLSDLLGYISSWSAFAKYEAKYGPDAAKEFLKNAKAKLLKEMNCEEDNPEVLNRHRYFIRMWKKPSL
ncbi:Methyltransferase type 11 [Trinorchestia longiramus]|nr:Methyltransferase type 11 [Trinorchestia longiramus]